MFQKMTNNIGFVATSLSFVFPPPPSHHIRPRLTPNHCTSFNPTTVHACLPRRRPPQQSWGSTKHPMWTNCQSNTAATGRMTITTTMKKTPTNGPTTRNRPHRPREGLERGEARVGEGTCPKVHTPIIDGNQLPSIRWDLHPPLVSTNDFHRKTAQDRNHKDAGLKSPPMSKQIPYVSPPLSFSFFLLFILILLLY